MPRTVKIPETIERVWQSVANSLNRSISKQASSLNLKPSTVNKILRQDLSMHPYKIVMAQKQTKLICLTVSCLLKK